MPTDLTGTPTSLGIGTYNVDADAPSGLGFNAAMAQIDALIASRLATPGGIVAGEVPVWNGSTWVRSSTLGMSASGISGFPSDATKVLQGDGAWGVRRLYLVTGTRTTALTGVTATTFAGGSAFLGTNLSFTADGTSNYLAELKGGYWSNASAGANNVLGLSFDGAEYNRLLCMSPSAGSSIPLNASFFISAPSAGVHSVNFVLYVGGGTGSITAGTANIAGNPGPVVGAVMRV